jgi:arabinofuranosyltransferase
MVKGEGKLRELTSGLPLSRVLRSKTHGMMGAILPAFILAWCGWQRRWVCDDAFIDFRIVGNILAGHGPVYNIGERVEVFTNPLWVIVLAAWRIMGLRLEIGAVTLGLILSIIGVVSAHAGTKVLHLQRTQGRYLIAPLGGVVVATLPPMWDFATSGLETGLTIAWLGMSWYQLCRLHKRTRSQAADTSSPVTTKSLLLTSLSIGMGPLIRPDLLIFTLGFLLGTIAILWKLGAGNQWIALTALTAAPAAAFEVFRMGYYASIVPNSALAKEATMSHWSQGWAYAQDFWGTYLLLIPVTLLLVHWVRETRIVIISRDWVSTAVWSIPIVCGVLHMSYFIRVGGDFMHGRLLLPSLFSLLLPVSVVYCTRSRGRIVWMVAIAIWALVCAMELRVPYEGAIARTGIADERGYYTRMAKVRNPITADDYANMPFARQGHALRQVAERCRSRRERVVLVDLANDPALGALPSRMSQGLPIAKDVSDAIDVVAIRWSIGLCGYLAGPHVHLIDRRGLSDPVGARLSLERRGRPGHEKVMNNEWMIARFADLGAVEDSRVLAAARALSCGDLQELSHSVRGPLTLTRFATNVFIAWKSKEMRIPTEPQASVDKFCSNHVGR